MRCRKYSQLEKDQLVKEVKDCGSISLVSKKHQIPSSTLHSWLKKLHPKKQKVSSEALKSTKALEKKIADQELKIKILEDLLKKTNQAWLGE